MDYTHVVHEFDPVYDERSEILILGSFPSVRSREEGFYYGHPQNRFWNVISYLMEEPLPGSVPEKKKLLLEHHIALWDVLAECDIRGSSDASIKNAEPNDLRRILDAACIRQIFTNGTAAGRLFHRFQERDVHETVIVLPSTSPANAARSLCNLYKEWAVINNYLTK